VNTVGGRNNKVRVRGDITTIGMRQNDEYSMK